MNLATDVTAEDIDVFLQEAEEHLQLLDEDIVRLEKRQEDSDLLQEIFRSAHTLKGSSAMLGYEQMTEVAHAMENLLDALRKGELPVTSELVTALLVSLDVLVVLKDGLVDSEIEEVDIGTALDLLSKIGLDGPVQGGVDTGSFDTNPLALNAEEGEYLRTLVEQGKEPFSVIVSFQEGAAWVAVRCFQLIGALTDAGDLIKSEPSAEDIEKERVGSGFKAVVATAQGETALQETAAQIEDVEDVDVSPYEAPVERVQESTEKSSSRQAERRQTLRIDVDRLDRLMNMVGELVIDRTRIIQITKALESRYREDDMVQALGKTSAHIVKVVDELQDSTHTVRMMPVGTVFSGLPRMMRDLAVDFGKQVDLIVEGQDTEIDRSVVERIRDPLVHLLRNAIDHGIESPEDRRATGKDETGTIRLSAAHAEGFIVIAVEDDGKGIDAQRVKTAALAKGLITAETAERLTDSEVVDMIFMPGMSTAKKTTAVSGRGVGMDIVRTNIEAVNGFVTVETRPGQGSRFNLRLPLTLATVQALLVSVDEALYAIPVVHVLEAVRLSAQDLQTIDGREVFRLRGQAVVPLLRMGAALGMKAEKAGAGESCYVVVVKLGEKLVGLGVDELTELQEIVVKSIGAYSGEARGVAGASILGDGRVVLILDVPTLINVAVFGARR